MADPGLNRSALVAGVFFIAAGVVFLLERLGVWDVSLRVLGPVLLITLGVAIVLGGRAHPPAP
jgi:LiaI-LiaF-like transmembrane region